MIPHPHRVSFTRFLPTALLVSTALAQSTTSGPFTADSFEANRYVLGNLAGLGFADGQDGWILFDSMALQPDLAAATVQNAVVRSGHRAVKWDAGMMSPGCFGELRRNALFNLTTGVIECEMDFLITSSSNPSAFWEFYTQPAPIPTTCQMRWFIGADGHIEYLTTPSRLLVVTNHFVSKDTWHHARTVVDIFGNSTSIYLDGVLVGSGQPICMAGQLPEHGFTQIDVDGAGNDIFYLDNFTVRERTAPHGLSVDLARLPINQRSVMDFDLAGGTALAGRYYAMLATLSGTSPGTAIGGVVLPLNNDGFMGIIITNLGTAALPGFVGVFNGDGNASASFDTQIALPAGMLGLNLDFAYLTMFPFDAVSEPARVQVTNL